MYIMDEAAKRGKVLLILSIVVFLGFPIFELITYTLYASNVGSERLASQFIQVALRSILSFYLYKGRRWIQILAGVLLILDAVSLLLRIVEAVTTSVPVTPFIVYIVFAFLVTVIFGIVLLRSRNVGNFLKFQRRREHRP